MLAAAISLSLGMTVAGCGGLSQNRSSSPSLRDVVAAAYVSPQTTDFGGNDDGKHGWVVLVRSDGSYRTVQTSGMDTAALLWDSSGLHFTDRTRDYTLNGASLTSVPSNKAWHGDPNGDLQNALLPGAGKTQTVGVYNFGVAPRGGYLTEVVTTNRRHATQRMLAGNYGLASSCGGVAYGITRDVLNGRTRRAMPARLRTMANGPRAHAVEFLANISGAQPEFIAGHVGASPAEPLGGYAPCQHGVMTFLMDLDHGHRTADRPRYTAALWQWNVHTGHVSSHPLRTASGRIFDDGRDSEGNSFYDGSSLVGDTLTWVDGTTGAIYRTSTATGRTKEIAASNCRNQHLAEYAAAITAKSVALLCTDSNANPNVQMRLLVFDRADGKLTTRLRIPKLNGQIGSPEVLRGIAVPPRS